MPASQSHRSDPIATPSPAPVESHAWLRFWLWLAAVIAVAVALRHLVVANTDVSYLLTLCEQILGGKRLYTDIIEVNPPMAMLAYMPGVLITRLLHVRAETVTDILVFVAIAVSVLATSRILRITYAFGAIHSRAFAIFCVAILAILPMQTFGQREHLVLIALLPSLAAAIARARGTGLPAWAVIVAGVGAGLALTFKPYFILPVGITIAVTAIHARSWRALFAPEVIVAAITVLIYAGITLIFYRDYFIVIYPMVRDMYVSVGQPLSAVLDNNGVIIWIVAWIATFAILRSGRWNAVTSVLGAASLGFALAYVLQRKGWAYQSYPMIALAMIAFGHALAHFDVERRRRVAGLALLAMLFLFGLRWMNDTPDARALEAPVARLGAHLGPHPKILVLSGEALIGQPLIRDVGGEPVYRQQTLWVQNFIALRRRTAPVDAATDARLDVYLARERTKLIEDIQRNPPDVVLVDNLLGDWGAWLRADPELSALLKSYRPVETVQKIDILAPAK